MQTLAATAVIAGVGPSPLVAVIPQPRWNGVDTLSQLEKPDPGRPVSPIEVVSFDRAFRQRWDTDAHFVGYMIEPFDPVVDAMFRMNKSSLKEIRASGHELLLNYVALDWDTPGHVPWTPAGAASFRDRVAGLLARQDAFSERLRSATFSYSTRNGFRWVFRLLHPLPVDEGEDVIRGLVKECYDRDLAVDKKCSDWTRLFRLPRVNRPLEA